MLRDLFEKTKHIFEDSNLIYLSVRSKAKRTKRAKRAKRIIRAGARMDIYSRGLLFTTHKGDSISI